MQFKLSELKAAHSRELGERVTWEMIAEATGIRRGTLIAMDQGNIRQIRPEYLDALCVYFGVGVEELMAREDVALPLPELRRQRATE